MVVVGSLNRDLTILAARHPAPGETVLGSGHYWANGGKGANQAVAAARMGARVAMIGAVGDDDHGQALVDSLAADAVDISGVHRESASETGLAVITVDSAAENTIVVSPGANLALDPDSLAPHAAMISSARVVLCQLEIPIDTVVAAADLTRGIFCLNPAPAKDLPTELMERVGILVPNRSELAHLSGKDARDDEEILAAATSLGRSGATIVTMGGDGAMVVQESEVVRIPAPSVQSVDPTAAGDTFCGTVAAFLAADLGLEEAVRRAVAAGAIATTRRGAQPSIPDFAELEAFLGA